MITTITCMDCGEERPIPSFLTEPFPPDCCHKSFDHQARGLFNLAQLASLRRYTWVITTCTEQMDRLADACMTSTEPEVRRAAHDWRQRRPSQPNPTTHDGSTPTEDPSHG